MINRRRGVAAALVLVAPLALAACSSAGQGAISSAASNLATRSPSVSLPTAEQTTPSLPTRSSTPTVEPTQTEDVAPTDTPTSPTGEPTTPTPTPTPTKTKTVTATATATATATQTETATPTPTPTTGTPSVSISAGESSAAAEETTSPTSYAWLWGLAALAALIAVIVAVVVSSQRRRRAAWAASVEDVYARGSLLADSLSSDVLSGDGSETPDQATRHDADLAAFLAASRPLVEAAPNDTARPAAQRVVDSTSAAQASLTQLRVSSPVDRPAAQQALATHVGGLRAALDDLRATTTPSN
jgi:hypothetical protein